MNTNSEISEVGEALFLFADVIDSSKYSSTLGYIEYAKQLHKLQMLFKTLGETYFPPLPVDQRIIRYSQVDARGDEGTIFCYNPEELAQDLIYKAIQFSYELKGRIEMLGSESPTSMKVGIGIHFDKVALIPSIVEDEKGIPRSIIHSLQGFAINYAKRIEACSRIGKYSKIILSKKAAGYLEGDPIVFTQRVSDLKGIQSDEDVYEIQSAFLHQLPYDGSCPGTEEFIEAYVNFEETCDFIHEPWQKSLVLSILSSLYDGAKLPNIKERYRQRKSDLAWMKPTEDDPIVLFFRAKICGEEAKHAQKLEYLRNLVNLYPNLIHARIKLAEACWEVAKGAEERVEIVYAKNIADEFLGKFDDYLSEEERRLYKEILSTSKGSPKKSMKRSAKKPWSSKKK